MPRCNIVSTAAMVLQVAAGITRRSDLLGLEQADLEECMSELLHGVFPADETTLEDEILLAEHKAIDSLAKYKFAMFGYWAGIWVHLNRISGKHRPNPFKSLVEAARLLGKQEDK